MSNTSTLTGYQLHFTTITFHRSVRWRKKNIFLIYNSGMFMLKFRHNKCLYNANGIPLHNEFQNKIISLIFQFSCFRMFIDLKHSFVHHIHIINIMPVFGDSKTHVQLSFETSHFLKLTYKKFIFKITFLILQFRNLIRDLVIWVNKMYANYS